MKNKQIQIQIPFRRSIVAVFFVVWGFIWLFFSDTGPFDNIIGGFFIVFGAVFFFYSLREVLRYKKTGEIKIRLDERTEIDALRASRRGFEFLFVSISVLMALFIFRFIPEIIFVSLMGTAVGVGTMVYIISFIDTSRRECEDGI